MKLKYGMNPYQDFAEVIDPQNALELVNGTPSVINVLDALNAWQLVKEASETLGKEAATSFKHVTPSGVAVAGTLSDAEKQAFLIKTEMSPLATAYARARGADRLASFGDFIALSHEVDESTARLIKAEVSDGLIAPGFSDEALEILKSKKKGKYVIFKIDKDYQPGETESRELFGINIKQKRNLLHISEELLKDIVTTNKTVPATVKSDLLLGMITLKYTQSNSICVAQGGRILGIGSGQQSRILCSGLALTKANVSFQKLQLDYGFLKSHEGLKRTELDQLIEQERQRVFNDKITLHELEDTCLLSDGFFPQPDNIELANQYGVKYIATPMGSIRDGEIIETANKHGMAIINTRVRLFHH
ncbi:MAG: 5-aminoimidazole-4-carboxamide ribonucleotide transformylase [Prolixibacteraceae bacterium]|nr:5-aminoimidazole-4-carboxamide ribonucleotide transformylase [Prolixibacteraceae bacterium]